MVSIRGDGRSCPLGLHGRRSRWLSCLSGDKIVFSIIVTSLLFTADVLALPSYLVMAKLHLIDTYMALIFPAFGSSLGLFLMLPIHGGATGQPD